MPSKSHSVVQFRRGCIPQMAVVDETKGNGSFGSSLGEALGRCNPALWWVSAATAVLLGLVLMWEPAHGLFRFNRLHTDGFALVTVAEALLARAVDGLNLT
jgi:hypothetical protein